MLTLRQKLLTVSDRYCAAVQRSRGRISTMIFGSGDRIDGVAGGKDLLTGSYEHAMLWFASNWPEGLDWPQGVERPELVEAAESNATDAVTQGAAA